jgi:hypothetical protein
MVDLYVDPDNEFYVVDSGDHSVQLVINLVSDNEHLIPQSEFLDLRRNMRHYTVSRGNVDGILESARLARLRAGTPPHYTEAYWNSYHGTLE